MRAGTKDALIFSTTGAIAMALVLFGVKKCNDNADEKAALKARAEIAESLLAGESELESENKTLVLQNDSLRKDLAVAGDSIVVLNDSIDVLNTKNTKLKNEKDSIIAELDDCKASKQPAVKKTPVKKKPVVESQPAKQPAKPETNKPMPVVQKPCEPVIIKQEPKNENTGSTTVNVNTPGNTINISNVGIINNFFGDCDAAEQKIQEQQYEKELEAYRNSVYISSQKVRCK